MLTICCRYQPLVFIIVELAGGPLARRENPAFSDWFDKVWKEVTSEAQDGKRKVSV